jgi:hypothetical protein
MTDAVIVLNAGPTSPKFGAYCPDAMKPLPLLCRGRIDSMRGDPHFAFNDGNGKPLDVHAWGQDGADRSQDSLAVRDHLFGIQGASIKVVAVHA